MPMKFGTAIKLVEQELLLLREDIVAGRKERWVGGREISLKRLCRRSTAWAANKFCRLVAALFSASSQAAALHAAHAKRWG